jgi:hypothetical protein
LNAGWNASPLHKVYVKRARELIRSEFRDAPLFVLKDPRICRLASFWLEVLDAEGIETGVVHPIRHPIEVSQSLNRRDLMRPEYGKLLWLRHVLDAEYATRDRRRFFCMYDELISDWQALVDRMSSGLEWAWPRLSAPVRKEIGGFISAGRRTLDREEGLGISSDEWTRSVFGTLEEWSKSGESAKGRALLDDVRVAFDKAAPTFAGMLLPGDYGGAPGDGGKLRLELERGLVESRERERELAQQIAAQAELLAQAEERMNRFSGVKGHVEKNEEDPFFKIVMRVGPFKLCERFADSQEDAECKLAEILDQATSSHTTSDSVTGQLE